MRIAYVTPYQGPTLLNRRPIVRNRSMSNRVKIELIATLLRASGHDVEIVSQGEVIENAWTFYPGFAEPEPFHPDVPVHYASVLPVRRLNGLWSNARTLQLLKARHRAAPFDLVIIFNMKGPQVACARWAIRRGIPVVLEYEDDRFVGIQGEEFTGLVSRLETGVARRLLRSVSACTGVSPHLLSQLPSGIPKVLLRGVVGTDVIESRVEKQNVVLYSGTHIATNGVAELIEAWRGLGLPDWELHITGYGAETDALRQMAADVPGIVFHGLVSRPELVRLLSTAKICICPQHVSQTPGNVFPFKVIEYLAAGAHVITTPLGALERELEAGVTYLPDHSPRTIASTIRGVVESRAYERTARAAAQATYGPSAVSKSLDGLLDRVVTGSASQRVAQARK